MTSRRCDHCDRSESHPAWDAWIEMTPSLSIALAEKSHPAWDAWIEITHQPTTKVSHKSHPAWDAWIEIELWRANMSFYSRIPHGMRGLKFANGNQGNLPLGSHPAWDAWIEIWPGQDCLQQPPDVASRMGCVD